MAGRRPGGRDHSGQTYGVVQVLRRVTGWLGGQLTLYEVRFLCCGTTGRLTHEQVGTRRQTVPGSCAQCRGGEEAKNSVARLRGEMNALAQQRDQARRDRDARIAAIRSENEARARAAHRARMGPMTFGQLALRHGRAG